MLRFPLIVFTMFATALSAQTFDRAVTEALQTCNDHIWFDIPAFKNLPKAAITVFPGMWDDNSTTVFWNVMWDDPKVRAAGNCVVKDGKISSFEDYTKP